MIFSDLLLYFKAYPVITGLFFALGLAGYIIDWYIYDKWIGAGNSSSISNHYKHICTGYRLICFIFFISLYIYPLEDDINCLKKSLEFNANEKYPSLDFYKIVLTFFSGIIIWGVKIAMSRVNHSKYISCLHLYFVGYCTFSVSIFLTAITNYNLSDYLHKFCLSNDTYVGGVLDMFLWFLFGFILIGIFKSVLFSLLKNS